MLNSIFFTECYTLVDALIWMLMGAMIMYGVRRAKK